MSRHESSPRHRGPVPERPPEFITRAQASEIDRRATIEFGVAGVVLMENAGRGVVDTLCQLGVTGRVVICAGLGNNGGDGFVIARHLDLRGFDVTVLSWADPGRLSSEALANLRIVEASRIELCVAPGASAVDQALAGASWAVDALLGTGARGEPRPPLDQVIDCLNASGLPVFAVDVPSGLDCDTGTAARATVRAAHTGTFVANKAGFLAAGADQFTGQIHVLDIGAPRVLVERVMRGAKSELRDAE